MDLARFFAVAAIVVVTPGPDMALVMRDTLAGGRSTGLVTSLGTCSGLLVHATAAALGLSAILLASSRAFTVVKLAGAAYLVGLGLIALFRSRAAEAETPSSAPRRVAGWAAYRQGVLTNVLNPKVAVFFLSLLPQFVEPGEGSTVRLLLLAGLFISLGFAWLTTYTFALDALGGVVSRARVRRAIERVTGAVLVALGVRLAFARR